MIGYLIEGASPLSAASDPRMQRLSLCGPWQYQPNAKGALATWRSNGPRPMAAFGTPRQTIDGMTYFPPKVLPDLNSLARPGILRREDARVVEVQNEQGILSVRIIPAYLSPKKILDTNMIGDYSTAYGRSVRLLLERINAGKGKLMFSDVCEEMHECVLRGLEYSYRLTRELVSDFSIVNEDSLLDLWEGCIHVPKDSAGSDSVPSAQP